MTDQDLKQKQNLEADNNTVNNATKNSSSNLNTQNARKILNIMIQEVIGREASDLHLVPRYPPMVRIDGVLYPLLKDKLTPKMVNIFAHLITPQEKLAEFEVNKEVDFSYTSDGIVRFRVNLYYTRNSPAIALRRIPIRIRELTQLHLPQVIGEFVHYPSGIVLVVGPTGSGKTTTIASLINQINMTQAKHIVTIEDPIEYIFPQGKSLVSQREIGRDTLGFKMALRAVLREDPDVVFIGEIRDPDTASTALQVAETGHLVFATLHTNSASQTLERYVALFDKGQEVIRSQLASVLKAVVSQRLIPVIGGGMRPAVEIMIVNDAIRNLIREAKYYQIDNVIKTSINQGMMPLELSLAQLVKENLIDLETAKQYSLFPNEIVNWL